MERDRSIHERGTITYLNKRAQTLLERPSEELKGSKLLPLVHPSDRKDLVEYHRNGFKPDPCEIRVGMPDGRWKRIRLSANLLQNEKAILCVASEVRNFPSTGDTLPQKDRFLQSLFNSIPQGISVLDREMNIVRVNPTMERWYAHSMPLVGKKCFQAYHGASYPCHGCPVVETLKTGKSARATVPLRDKNGDPIGWLNLQSSPLRDVETGELVGVIEYVEDITETKKTKEALKRSQELFSSALTASSDWMSLTKLPEGHYVEVNEAFEKKTGYARDEVLGKTPLELGIWVDPSKREEALRILLDQGTLRDFEAEFRLKSGEVRTFSVSADIVELGGEKLSLAICRDITERKELERQLALSQKMEAIGRLAGGIAHDFNNLLTIIMGQTDLLLLTMSEGDKGREALEEIRQAAKKAASLTRQLLAFSKRQVLKPKILDLNSIVSDMERMLSRLIGEDVEIITVRDPGLWRVRLDPAQMEQVLLNLAVNARDAMPKGGRLRIETSNLWLKERPHGSWAGGFAPGPYVVLKVSDTGMGMDESTKQKIFEPFFTTKEKGTGLGLATVYGIVAQSGGHIEVESCPGSGTTFSLYFPAVETEELLATTGGDVLTGTWSGSQTVLVAEDEPMVRRLICSVLKERGYTVLEAEDGLAASRLAEQYNGPIHLLITDVVMPAMSGQELTKRVKASRPGTKILYISGYTEEAISRFGALDEGAFFLEKPFTPDSLARKIREILGTG